MYKEKPILFSTEMVKAILDGRKSQTRRIVKYPPFDPSDDGLDQEYYLGNLKPRFNKGDHLWVKETFYIHPCNCCVTYKAGLDITRYPTDKWKPSIFMPKKYARIWLEVTNVRVERLQDISEQDAIAEGIKKVVLGEQVEYGFIDKKGNPKFWLDPKRAYSELWESINGKGSWELNPWVWVIEFKKINN